MKRWKFTVLLVVAMLVPFVCGLIVCFVVMLLSVEGREARLEGLQDEAAGFFYDTMRELFAGTYDEQEKRVSHEALGEFNGYRARLEPRCWLVNMEEDYGVFHGRALFPSGDVFEVGMEKTDKGWVLSLLNHMGTKYFFHDLSGVKESPGTTQGYP